MKTTFTALEVARIVDLKRTRSQTWWALCMIKATREGCTMWEIALKTADSEDA